MKKVNLVQKWPVGLGLALILGMSSCSKEDIQSPQPEPESFNVNSSLRQTTPLLSAMPAFPSTQGPTGLYVYPSHWERSNQASPLLALFPTGTSNLNYQWGDPKLPWAKPLAATQFVPANATFLTATTQFSPNDPQGDRSGVKTKIKNLKKGKKYAILFNVSTTIGDLRPGQISAAYSKGVIIRRYETEPGFEKSFVELVDLTGKANQWVPHTVIFTAQASEAEFTFLPETAPKGEYNWVNIYVDKTSIKELN